MRGVHVFFIIIFCCFALLFLLRPSFWPRHLLKVLKDDVNLCIAQKRHRVYPRDGPSRHIRVFTIGFCQDPCVGREPQLLTFRRGETQSQPGHFCHRHHFRFFFFFFSLCFISCCASSCYFLHSMYCFIFSLFFSSFSFCLYFLSFPTRKKQDLPCHDSRPWSLMDTFVFSLIPL